MIVTTGKVDVINPIFQVRNLRLRDVKPGAQRHTANKRESQDWKWGASDFKARTPSPHLTPQECPAPCFTPCHLSPGALSSGVNPTPLPVVSLKHSLPGLSPQQPRMLGAAWGRCSPRPSQSPLAHPGPSSPVTGGHPLSDTNLQPSQA